MATRIETTLVCDKCGRDEGDDRVVESHELVVDGIEVSGDACAQCWSKAIAGLSFLDGATKVETRTTAVCLDCQPARRFDTERGLATHLRRAHAHLASVG